MAAAALRRLVALDSAKSLSDLLIPPSNRLEALSGSHKGQHSIRINDQYHVWSTLGEGHALEELGLSLNRLSREIHVPANRISSIVGGQRSITGETALRLARYLGTTPEYWLNMQARYDLETARDTWAERVVSEVRPREAVGVHRSW